MLRHGSPSEIGAYLVRFTDGNFGLAARMPTDDGFIGWSDIVDEAGLIRPADSIVAYDDGVEQTCEPLGRGRHVALASDGLFFRVTCLWCGWIADATLEPPGAESGTPM